MHAHTYRLTLPLTHLHYRYQQYKGQLVGISYKETKFQEVLGPETIRVNVPMDWTWQVDGVGKT